MLFGHEKENILHPVSYTHLDVYKRQPQGQSLATYHTAYATPYVLHKAGTVSYTHLNLF